MRYPRLSATLLATVITAAMAPAVSAEVAAPDADTLAASVEAAVVGWRRDLHEHPELGNREHRTSALVAGHLRALGLDDVRTGIAHTGVTAVLRGGLPGPRLALRADMDALPVTERTGLPFASKATAQFRGETVGVMHACGHARIPRSSWAWRRPWPACANSCQAKCSSSSSPPRKVRRKARTAAPS